MRTLLSIGLVATMFLGASGRALAHHSHAMFDHDIEMTITGTVTDFAFNNPHVFLYLDVAQDDGEVVKYWIEMSNIPNMIRRGISPRTFQVGDVVRLNMWPLKDGRPGGNYITIVAADGKTYD